MYSCKACLHRTGSLKGYAQHYRMHSNEANIKFPCAVRGCTRPFRTYNAFKSHVTRDHGHLRNDRQETLIDISETIEMRCPFDFCAQVVRNLNDLLQHLKSHIAQDTEVTCPFQGCGFKFRVKSSFSSHLSRRHRDTSNRKVLQNLVINPNSYYLNNNVQVTDMPCTSSDSLDDSTFGDSENNSNDDENDRELFLKNLALFYLKLSAKYHMPATTVQMVVQEMQSMHSISQNYLRGHIKTKMEEIAISEMQVNEITEEIFNNDIFNNVHADKGPLSTDYMRKQYFKNNFRYVAPVAICLGFDKDNVKRCCEYIPIVNTITEFLKDKSVKEQFDNPIPSQEGVLQDITDGSVTKSNVLFNEVPNALKLLLYQDSFEVVNPLGSGKKKHKVLAVYVTLGNIYPENRSKVDQMQLVLLVREADFKYFGQHIVFRELVNDLKEIEESGVLVGNEYIRGTVAMFLGDNLGSHCIGGFTENFSSTSHVCRSCLITSDHIKSGEVLDIFPERTPSNYIEAVEKVESNTELSHYHGIKFNSIFNELRYYHVCKPGLPPCLGHDLFEGVVQYDLALFINYLVKVRKWFTYVSLNQMITKFKYKGSDANDKPNILNDKSKKLGGHAVQNWCFLRLLPVFICLNVQDTSDKVWGLILLLREIVELVCAPKITFGQVAYLRIKIEEYLELRVGLFPETPLRPKHHYLAHYPRQLLQFGPLMRVWTLRFESKHSYFKRCARYSQNFINICRTFAERHQLLQAYYSSGSLFGSSVCLEDAIPLNLDLYSDCIKDAFKNHHLASREVVTSLSGIVHGIKYKKDDYIAIEFTQFGLVFGKIVMLFQHNACSVCFLIKIIQAVYKPEMGYYNILHVSQPVYKCFSHSCIKSYSCLPSYTKNNEEIIILKHAVVDV